MSRPAAEALTIDRVAAAYGGHPVLKGISLEVAPGELFAFLGPSGCGKTTLLRVVAGFVRADAGSVSIGGADITALPPWKRGVGLVFQSYALWPHMTVAQNVAFGLEERRLPRAEIRRRVVQALELVGLAALAERRPSQLSGGQQQRVALARTVAIEPRVLLLDEPLSNLDAQLRIQVRRELREMQRRLGLTTVFVTHDQEEVNTICDRIAVMREGTVEQVGTPVALYARPATLFVARFLGTANVLEGTVDGRSFALRAGGRAPLPADAPAGARLVFRPQDLDAGGDGLTLSGTVVEREFLGTAVRYRLRLGTEEVLVDRPFRSGDRLAEVGDAMTVTLPAQRMLWLA